MEKLFIILLSACIALFIAELFIFICKGIIFIGCIIANKCADVNFRSNVIVITILSFIISFLLLIF